MDDVGRAKSFYGKLFGWKIKKMPTKMPVDYYHIDTAGGGGNYPDGGLMKRQMPEQQEHYKLHRFVASDGQNPLATRREATGES